MSCPVSGGQCHLNHLTILRRFSWPSLAYMCQSPSPINFIYCCFKSPVTVFSSRQLLLFQVTSYCCFKSRVTVVSSRQLLLFQVTSYCCFKSPATAISSCELLLLKSRVTVVLSRQLLLFQVASYCCFKSAVTAAGGAAITVLCSYGSYSCLTLHGSVAQI